MDLLGSILGSMEKPPTVGGEERKRAKALQKRAEKLQEQERKKIDAFRAKIQERVNGFIKDSEKEKHRFEPMEKVCRAIVHEVSDVAGLTSFSFGQDEVDRYVMVWKKEFAPTDEELATLRRGEDWDPEKAAQAAQQKKESELEAERSLRESKNSAEPVSTVYRAKYEHLLGTTAAKEAARSTNTNRTYGFVSSENKRDRRTIEEVMAESRARKKLKSNPPKPEVTSSDSVTPNVTSDVISDVASERAAFSTESDTAQEAS